MLSRHLTDLLVFTAIYTIAGIGVGLLLGQCGIVNLGQAAFYGIGAYSCAYLTVELGYPNIAGFVVGAAISMAIALVVGWPVLRLTGYFLALATLALSIIASSIFYEWDWLTGGELGIGGIPKLDFFGFKLDTPGRFYYLAWGVAFLCMLLVQQPGAQPHRPDAARHARFERGRREPRRRSAMAAHARVHAERAARQHRRQPVRPLRLVHQRAELHRRQVDRLPADPGAGRRALAVGRRAGRVVRHHPARSG